MRYILHIGRAKTGTTSLQRFLHTNRDALVQCGLYYPESGLSNIAHHDIAKYFTRSIRHPGKKNKLSRLKGLFNILMDKISKKTLSQLEGIFNTLIDKISKKTRYILPTEGKNGLARLEAIVDALFREISKKEKTILLSSEAFQNSDPKLLKERFDRASTRIIVYIREQVDFAVSAYQQEVHAKDYCISLDESVNRFIVDYNFFLGQWEKVFGRENIEVRVFDRRHLLQGDIIHDFMKNLDIDITKNFSVSLLDQNPSIGGALLEFKRMLNAFGIDQQINNKLYRIFSIIAADNAHYRRKPLLDSKLIDSIRNSVSKSNQQVFDRYFGGIDMFADPNYRQVDGGAEISKTDLWQILSEIKKKDLIVFENIVTTLLSGQQGAAINSTSRDIARTSANGPISDNLIRLLQNVVDVRLSPGKKFKWNIYAPQI